MPQQLQRVLDTVYSGYFGDTHSVDHVLGEMVDGGDTGLVCFDFESFVQAQERADEAYRDKDKWTEKAILGLARCGHFSSDRTVKQFCEDVWDIKPVSVPQPSTQPEKRVQSMSNLLE